MWLAKRVLAPLADSHGFFVNVSGVVADTPMPGMAAYSASKAAVAAAMDSVRREFRRSKVHVVDVRPPHTETGLADHPLDGAAPKMPEGLAPRSVADRIVLAIEQGDAVVTADQF
jgi:cyclic-di-GMP-binding biofilm dispersal mediator protein